MFYKFFTLTMVVIGLSCMVAFMVLTWLAGFPLLAICEFVVLTANFSGQIEEKIGHLRKEHEKK